MLALKIAAASASKIGSGRALSQRRDFETGLVDLVPEMFDLRPVSWETERSKPGVSCWRMMLKGRAA